MTLKNLIIPRLSGDEKLEVPRTCQGFREMTEKEQYDRDESQGEEYYSKG